jgi:hypothetical protein
MQNDYRRISTNQVEQAQPQPSDVFKKKHTSLPSAKNYGNGKLRTITILKD